MLRTTVLTLILTSFALDGCVSSEPMDADDSSAQGTAAADDPEYLGPRVAVTHDGAEQSAQPLETIAAMPEAAAPRIEDSRPEWWFEGVREVDGRQSVCAEALARDLADARRRAVLIARDIARELLGASETSGGVSEQILRTAVAPLPAAKGAQYRYVVYVEVARTRKP